jgi:hypothetical protein
MKHKFRLICSKYIGQSIESRLALVKMPIYVGCIQKISVPGSTSNLTTSHSKSPIEPY